MIRKAVLVFALLYSALSCAEYKFSEEKISFQLTHSYYTTNGVRLEKQPYEEGLKFIFPAIPKQISGNPSNQPILAQSFPNKDQLFSLELPKHIELNDWMKTEDDFPSKPKNIGLVRLGTFSLVGDNYDDIQGGAFIDKVSGDILILVYVSEAVRMEKASENWPEDALVDLQFNHQGWHWIKAQELPNGNDKLTNFGGSVSNIEFMIFYKGLSGY